MNLFYRGCQYQKQAVSLAVRQNQINLKYRGVNHTLQEGKQNIAKSNVLLTYRGVHYYIGNSYSTYKTPTTFAVNSVIA